MLSRTTLLLVVSCMLATMTFTACGHEEDKTPPPVQPIQNEGNDNNINDNNNGGDSNTNDDDNNNNNNNNTDVSAPVNAQAVDLGLPSGTKWANMNVGATAPEDYGLYFAWGETTGYKGDASDGHSFDWNNYELCADAYRGTMKKYNQNSDYGTVDNLMTLEAADDAARANWGGEWRMPTLSDVEELLENTTFVWTTLNGIYGHRFTSKNNGNSVFLPAAGFRRGTNFYEGDGWYWTSSLHKSNSQSAYDFFFTYSTSSSKAYAYSDSWLRPTGYSVRPVCGGSGSGSSGGDTSPVWGKVKGTISAIGPGVAYSSEASFADGKSTTVDYVYYPTTDTYYVYGGTFCSQPEVNGGKGLRYDAKKGYNSITIKYGYYYDYSTKIKYDWELRLHVTLP